MNSVKFIFYFIVLVSCCFTSCESKIENKVDEAKIGKIKKVLILGNSIVFHEPNPEIGWYGNWGMAASSEQNDFVHILIKKMKQSDTSVAIQYKSIAEFERNFTNYSFTDLDTVRGNDLIIIKLSENVNAVKAVKDSFIHYYDSLLHYLDPNNTAVKVIVNGFWDNEIVNNQLKQFAIKSNYPFISIEKLYRDKSNLALGKFENSGLAHHPSDTGMEKIAEEIWKYVGNYFIKRNN